MRFAVVDIETTGGYADRNRIIEIAIVVFDGEKVIDRFEQLINPERAIPPFISSLTGITNEMVLEAPTFEQISEEVASRTESCVFVAHNVNFDYTFLKHEFERVGISFVRKKLCTVRLTRKVFPGLKSYSLGNICAQFDIPNHDRHRAMGDAEATTRLLKHIIAHDVTDAIKQSLKRNSREAKLPPLLDKEIYLALPQLPGVYYMHDERGKILYIGKAKNIRKRIDGHFSVDSTLRKSNMLNKVADITYELCGNELIALLHESAEIKKHWPEYNRAQKYTSRTYGLFKYEDKNGYERLSLGQKRAGMKEVRFVRSMNEGRQLLYDLKAQFQLCPKLIGLQVTSKACFDHQLGQCDGACVGKIKPEEHNARIEAAIDSMANFASSFVLVGKGRSEEERSFVLVEKGAFKGYGFVDANVSIQYKEQWDQFLIPAQDNREIHSIIYRYIGHKEYTYLNLE